MYSEHRILDNRPSTSRNIHFPSGDVARGRRTPANGRLPTHSSLEDISDRCTASDDSELDDEQLLSATLQLGGVAQEYSRLPISQAPPAASQNIISASPAALFLSSFSSPVVSSPLPDDEGQVMSGYTLGSIIGYGGSSIIRRAFSASGGVVAVKIIRRADLVKHGNAPLARKRLEHEAAVWATLSHEHILPLFSAFHTSYADYFITLLCPAGSLFDILKRDGQPALPQDDAGMMFRQVVRGLRYLHEVAMYVHRDMKLENVLVDEMGVCKIGDFGMARKIGELDDEEEWLEEQDDYRHSAVHRAASLAVPSPRRHTRIGLQPNPAVLRHSSVRHRNSTSAAQSDPHDHVYQPGSLPYAAPELLLPQTAGLLAPNPAQDIWALGVMLYALFTGRWPFRDSFEPRLQMKIMNGVYEVPTDIGRGAERVLKGCLDRSVQDRWTVAMVDDVAWEVGWGSQSDHVSPIDSDEELPPRRKITPQSRSRSRPADISIPSIPSWQQEQSRSRPALDAASRRSSSRAKRSLSRAPLMSSRTTSARSASRPTSSRAPSPSMSVLNNSVMSSSIISNSSLFSQNQDFALIVSPSSSLERGRTHTKTTFQFSSRSPSPNVVPTTPVDTEDRYNPLSFINDQPDESDLLESPRGRPVLTRSVRHFQSEDIFPSGEDALKLGDLKQNTFWKRPDNSSADKGAGTFIEKVTRHENERIPIDIPVSSQKACRSASRDDQTSHSPHNTERRRHTSTPPAGKTRSSRHGIGSHVLAGDAFLSPYVGTPVGGLMTRSKSMNDERPTAVTN